MKKTIVSSFILPVLFATPAFASMNFIGDGYKVPPACTSDDHSIIETVSGQTVVTGCWTPTAWNASFAQTSQRTFKFGASQSVTLKSGRVETCPWFFSAGCVINPTLIQ